MKNLGISEEAYKKFREAGRIAGQVREAMRKYVREGMPIIDICEKAESMTREKGGKPAFPCNVSVNEIAAHYTSPPGDQRVIPEKSIVKVDIGVHVDGYVADTATTVCFNPEWKDLVYAAEQALETGIKTLRPKMSTSEFGSTIEKTIKRLGLKPISNLTGHQVGRYLVHAGKSLPNVSHILGPRINLGEVYAIEPFVTVASAAGKVKSGKEATIFRLHKRKSPKDVYAKKLLSYAEKNFRTLPFAERWLVNVVPKEQHATAFKELLSSKCFFSYPVYIEASGKPVAQAEHTVLVVEDGCVVLTKP